MSIMAAMLGIGKGLTSLEAGDRSGYLYTSGEKNRERGEEKEKHKS